MRPFNLIAACSENRVIGRGGRLPWRIAEDRDFFMETTAGQVVVMGRICYETWASAAQDGRRPVVVTSRSYPPPLRAALSLPAALEVAAGLPGEIFVCGGQRIFEEAIGMPAAARLHLTLVHEVVTGDRTFPDWTGIFTREVARREGSGDGLRYTFLTLER